MIARRLGLLVVLVLALAGALAALRARRADRLPDALFPGFDARAIARVTIGPRQPPAGQGQQSVLTLERGADGAFALRERFGFRAGAVDLDGWLARVAALRGGARAGADPRAAELGLGEQALEIALFDARGARVASLVQGRADGDASFVAPASGSPQAGGVWRVPRWQRLSATPLAWLDTRIPLPAAAEWRRIELELGGARVECARDEAGRWSCAGKPVPKDALERLGQLCDALYFADVLAAAPRAEDGFAAPRARLVVHPAAGAAVELALGAAATHALTASVWSAPFVVALGAETDALLVGALEGLFAASGGAPSQR
ncbi:MAG: hypothetical protein EPO68_03965 [Planctomycetota bacterium]|nr:MAG: hypothetical protein EPO68_03965 [Planctomycetota bacterium]